MKKLFMVVLIAVFLAAPPVMAKEITLRFAWSANTEPDMAGYAMFIRQEGQQYNYNNPIDPVCTIVDGFCYTNPITKLCEYEHTFEAPDGFLTTFYFVVRAGDIEGFWSADSNEVDATFDLRVMPAPTMLAGVYDDDIKIINFTWQQTDADRVLKWELFNSSTSGGPYTKVGKLVNIGLLSPYSLLWNVPGDGNYHFVLVAFTSELNSADSNEAYVQVKDHPSPVRNFKVKIRIQ